MENQKYFDEEIKPFLGNGIEYLGEIDNAEKISLLRGSQGFLHLNTYQEGFGLTLIEAMACGTPVIGMNKGSIPEVIDNGKTGYVCESLDEAENAIKSIDKIQRIDCRHRVEEMFSIETMVKNYEEVYFKLTGKR